MTKIQNNFIEPIDVVRYILYRFCFDGDVVTNLKMQKLLYFVYVWYLVKSRKRCFEGKFQAWPIGPVLPSVYKKLRGYKSSPINPDFTNIGSENDVEELKKALGVPLVKVIDEVYEKYGTKSAFDLVNLTHNALPWTNARKGLDPTETTNNEITDADILKQYGKE